MKITQSFLLGSGIFIVLFHTAFAGQEKNIKAQIKATNNAVKSEFKAANIEGILRYHHPNVEKYLAWDNRQVGHSGMRKALNTTPKNYRLIFNDSPEMESFTATDDMAVMITIFQLHGEPITKEVEPWTAEGRTMIV